MRYFILLLIYVCTNYAHGQEQSRQEVDYLNYRSLMSNLFDCNNPQLPTPNEPIKLDCEVYGYWDVEKSLLLQYDFQGLLNTIERNEFGMEHILHKRQENGTTNRWCGLAEMVSNDRLTIKMNQCLADNKDKIFQAIGRDDHLSSDDKEFLRYYVNYMLYQQNFIKDTTLQLEVLRLSKSIFETSMDSSQVNFVKKYSTYNKVTSAFGVGFKLGITVPLFSNSIQSEFTSVPGLNFGAHLNIYRFFIEASRNISALKTKNEYDWVGVHYPIGTWFDFQTVNINFGYRFSLSDRFTFAPTVGRLFTDVRTRISLEEDEFLTTPARSFKILSTNIGGYIEFDIDSRFSNSIQKNKKRPLKDYALSIYAGYHYTFYDLDSEYLNFNGGSSIISVGLIFQFQGLVYKNYLEPHKKVQYKGPS